MRHLAWPTTPQLSRVAKFAAWFLVFDFLIIAVTWYGLHCVLGPPAALPEGAPIAVFYTTDPIGRELRLRAAAAAYQAYGPRAILSVGGSRPNRNYYGSEVMADRLQHLGIKAEHIRTERTSLDTISNIEAARALAPNAKAVLIVTDALHILRIRWMMRQHWPEATALPYPPTLDLDPRTALLRVHYEAVAWLQALLPSGLQETLVQSLRK